MSDGPLSAIFSKDLAASYDEKFSKLAPMKDVLHLSIQVLLSDLPENANILCVGAGTGAELMYLAQAFPLWRFTVVEPAPAMLDICRQRAEVNGITSRCCFHLGYLGSLPSNELFDAATCLLVSQFILDKTERRALFANIAERLYPGGILVSADLSGDTASIEFKRLFEVWLKMLAYSGMSAEQLQGYQDNFGKDIAVLSQQEITEMLAVSGFDSPILFLQTLLIHAWCSKRL
ncbi:MULTISPECIES: class I SAM-dependent methyltransferase [unclassified Moritella]|uniref:class I SAM-dependent methyltransferase n=1 Tax=unclassified Moritella TaxID=2637987 RepID=UPI001BA69EBB|nr:MULTISPECIES: class I SAM-dependent methyltransferase [unclassified Moritella]QUM84779.1 class I SAM-dependent methyltransferase [Moritella sp. 28]QUM89024.1 class I SAM-dependent methyltransferase [Moritella sp. 36]